MRLGGRYGCKPIKFDLDLCFVFAKFLFSQLSGTRFWSKTQSAHHCCSVDLSSVVGVRIMLQSLISMSDSEIDLVLTAVRRWCISNHCEIDSTDGRRAVTVAIDLVQSHRTDDDITVELTRRLAPCEEKEVPIQ